MNELVFLIKLLAGLTLTLIAFRLGKEWLFALVAVYVVLANIFVTKQIILLGMAATGGNAVYGCVFFATDLLSEHHSKKDAKKAVMIGFFASLILLIMSQLIIVFAPSSEDFVQDGMKTIFTFIPRIIAASMAAYLISQFHDIWAFHFWKKRTKGKYLWLRNNLSTYVSQLIDSIVFVTLAFAGVFSWSVIWQIIITTYLLKIIVAIIDTPFIYLSYVIIPGTRRPTETA
ncbi:queuosine precursor transporter [bacterium]|nr:queuosine precursor transporter [FCB group bacterium]MBL7190395.1 queuosine precursor transporter [bacterium]